MKFYTGYYWQQGDERTTLVLKHLVYHNGQPACFAVLCETGEEVGEEASTAEELKKWIYEEGFALCAKRGREPESLKKQLEKQIDRIWNRQEESVALLVCMGEYFVLWGRGAGTVYLLNYRLGKPHVRVLPEAAAGNILCGEFRKHTGILLATADFCNAVPSEKIAECLDMKELACEERVQRHIKELGDLAVRKGGQHVECVLVKAV